MFLQRYIHVYCEHSLELLLFQYDDPNATIASIIAEVKKYVSTCRM